MKKYALCMLTVTLSLWMAGASMAAVSPDGKGGVVYQTSTVGTSTYGVSPDGRGGMVQNVLSSVSPDGKGGTVVTAASSQTTGSSSVNGTMYTTNYTGTSGGYVLNGVMYNTLNVGPMAGNQAASGLSQLGNPSQMNPAGTHYSSSSTVINTRRVVANTYASNGWQFESKGMWYLYTDGTYPVSSWRSIDGANYHFNAEGYLEVNTWVYEANGAWYYTGADGKIARGLQNIGGRLYYFDENSGQLQGPGLLLVNGRYYFAGQDGALLQNSWVSGFFYGADGARV